MSEAALYHRLLPGTYADSLVLMQLQLALTRRPGVIDAAVAMATPANCELIAAQGLLPDEAVAARPDDLLVTVRAESEAAAEAALGSVPELLRTRCGAGAAVAYRARSLAAALRDLPEARWVLVSVPGRWAAGVAREALQAGRHVFLYSDNVPLAEEVELKREARRRGLLALGPDCGTAIIGGVGFGFANRVRRGAIGLVAASGSGLQAVACSVHDLGGGISHALGVGGRDLGSEVGGSAALAALDLLGRDPETRVIVLISKPPAPEVTARLLQAARACGKPVVAWLVGAAVPARRVGDVRFAVSSREAAELAVAATTDVAAELVSAEKSGRSRQTAETSSAATAPPLLRGFFAGGTLAQEAFLALQPWVAPLATNLKLPGALPLSDPAAAGAHTIVDLGDDELTVGRAHPMLDPRLRLEHLATAAEEAAVGVVLLDVVLGDGSHPDPAAELAPAIAGARKGAERAGGALEVVAILLGTDEDPQGLESQAERLRTAGARVISSTTEAVELAVEILASEPLSKAPGGGAAPRPATPPVSGDALAPPTVVNIGLEAFHQSLLAQGAHALHVAWRPPAGGDPRLARILERMR